MAQQPTVVIIARHGPRLDAADQSWHLSTPTPYDPPLTYGGWNQSRTLGVRIASVLHEREQDANEDTGEESSDAAKARSPNGEESSDAAKARSPNGGEKRKDSATDEGSRKRRKKKHKVVIHTSPFLRCLQTSVAIASGMAQFQPPSEPGSQPSTSKARTPGQLHSASPRMRSADGTGSPNLAPIAEPKHDFAHAIARRALHEQRRHRKAKLRVDAFLGEWLNPQYFDQITPPPPSSMMVAAAKAELVQNEAVDVFTPSVSTKSSVSSLWGGGANGQKSASGDSTLDEWNDLRDAISAPNPKRDRSSSVSSIGSNDSGSGRRSPFRPGHVLQPFTSTVLKAERSVYVPPTPQYAVSSSEVIPRGYVSHARQACVHVDYHWDSSRPPQDWGDGGEYGEEWSAMHKRFRRGLNHLIRWYGQNGTDDRAEDALGVEQAEKHEDEEQEDLVVILVTHGAGSNALIGALTGQPVLLDVGMASLTMAVRKQDAPSVPPAALLTNGHARRGSLDMGLSSVYEMRLVSSSEHLRPGADPMKAPSTFRAPALGRTRDEFSTGDPVGSSSSEGSGFLDAEVRQRSSTSTAFGSMRRPSGPNFAAPPPPAPSPLTKSNTVPVGSEMDELPPITFTGGLWTPPTSRTPLLQAQEKAKEERESIFSKLNDSSSGRVSPGHGMELDLSNSPPDSRPTSSGGSRAPPQIAAKAKPQEMPPPRSLALALSGDLDGTNDSRNSHSAGEIPTVGENPPQALSRGLSQRGLWGSKPAGDKVARKFPQQPKRRWTVNQDEKGR